ncbi:hypothetical protein ACFL4N_01750 [Thermodesulfobacteriota bacterium]
MKIFNTRWILLTAILLLIIPNPAYAHGDPIIVYYFIGFTVLDIAGFLYLLISQRTKLIRGPAIAIFFIIALLSWYWTANSQGPDYVFWIKKASPTWLGFACLIWIVEIIRKNR